ncbi:MAG TPA: right-handed parallel beta-helix repeat-containing protein, partial [Thermoanaerobaculia bacterium]|nr:right-handed parallel beta-helix repeat-containing protein [Thermoanaerobaculia bacterium]
IMLYRDGGDGQPTGADDALVTSTKTDASGRYAFQPPGAGTYWVVVDSRTVTPAAGLVSSGAGPVWAEQTYGPAGALCARRSGPPTQNFVGGPCFGGRFADASDDASQLSTSKHIARVDPTSEHAASLDFAFSFNVAVSSRDGDAPLQGSIRQFLLNANAIRGPNALRFVPVSASRTSSTTPGDIKPLRWWTVELLAPFPALTDDDTTIDGTGYSLLLPTTAINEQPVPPKETAEPPRGKIRVGVPDLELVFSGEKVLAVNAKTTIRNVAIRGAKTNVEANADLELDHVIVGAHADSAREPVVSDAGVRIVSGTTTVRSCFIADQSKNGIIATPHGELVTNGVEITGCGSTEAGGAIALQSSGSHIQAAFLHNNDGVGIEVGLEGQGVTASKNWVESSTISSNLAGILLASNATDNKFIHDDLMWNRKGGIVAANYAPAALPQRNEITENHFDENGGFPINLTSSIDDPRQRQQQIEDRPCSYADTAPNRGLPPPHIGAVRLLNQRSGTANHTLKVTGTTCPGLAVEIYLSYVTYDLRGQLEKRSVPDIPSVREAHNDTKSLESRDPDTATRREMPSIGEFKYLMAVHADAQGNFEAMVPVEDEDKLTLPDPRNDVWKPQGIVTFNDLMGYRDMRTSSIGALAIDPEGNTSEFSKRIEIQRR